ncbi:hybrid sensor histidine kinase/response regulator [Roseiconus lacunae]|uniref:hybrid sensor histidine kinase/response regulator n=1 Tax=Roseiconus lacunae TaxID=2605694 RepID=UPI00308924C5|nr:hybrid sensor histidine kinase/response regulator [Stieleria sp. HD01]
MSRVLLIEDDEVDRRNVIRMLSLALPEWSIRSSTCLLDAERELSEFEFDVILCDLSLPDSIGISSLVRVLHAASGVPIIVLTGLESDKTSMDALMEGAQDYLNKNQITPELIRRSIQYSVQRNHLSQRNAELMASLVKSEEALRIQNRRLRKACETAQQFVDNVSHEFRTPLTVIKEYASIMAEGMVGPVPDKQLRLLRTIDDRASDLNNMVDDMLDISKLESGLLTACREKCSVESIIDNVSSALQQKAAIREIELEISVADDLPDVFCDAGKATRTLINLGVNALKFASHHVEVKVQFQTPHDVAFTVIDDGPGIPDEQKELIFQRFSQLQSNVDNAGKGFGLGLNIVSELVAINLGRLSVDSKDGSGSEFTFTLPTCDHLEVAKRFIDHSSRNANCPQTVALLKSTIPIDQDAIGDDVRKFFLCTLRQNDLLLQIDRRSYLILAAVDQIQLSEMGFRIEEQRARLNRNRLSSPLPELPLENLGMYHLDQKNEVLIDKVAEQITDREYSYV